MRSRVASLSCQAKAVKFNRVSSIFCGSRNQFSCKKSAGDIFNALSAAFLAINDDADAAVAISPR